MKLDYRELQKFTIDPEAFNELHSLLLTVLHDLSSIIRIDNLPKANGGSLKYYNESDRIDQSYTIASPNFQMKLYALIGVSCHLTDNSRTINQDKKCQASDIIDIFSGYNNNTKCFHDFLIQLMKTFAPILLGDLALRKQLLIICTHLRMMTIPLMHSSVGYQVVKILVHYQQVSNQQVLILLHLHVNLRILHMVQFLQSHCIISLICLLMQITRSTLPS